MNNKNRRKDKSLIWLELADDARQDGLFENALNCLEKIEITNNNEEKALNIKAMSYSGLAKKYRDEKNEIKEKEYSDLALDTSQKLYNTGYRDSETINILAAHKKRFILNKKPLNDLSEDELNTLKEARNLYYTIFEKNKEYNYYSAINVAYLDMILANDLESGREEAEKTLSKLKKDFPKELNEEDKYWSYITEAEVSLLRGNYEDAKEKIYKMAQSKDVLIKSFHLVSTLRQLEDIFIFYMRDKMSKDELKELEDKVVSTLRNLLFLIDFSKIKI